MAAAPASVASRMVAILALLLCAAIVVIADDEATIAAETDVPEWASDNVLQLSLSTSGGNWLPLQFTVIPLTANLGLNESAISRDIIKINGNMIAADATNYNKIDGTNDVAYLSCDDPADDSFIQPDKILNDLMKVRPKIRAIVLYSTNRNWCSLSHGAPLQYESILTMADAAEATQALGFLNGTNSGTLVKVSISGNNTSNNADGHKKSNGSNSAVAMSILYSITGLITLLFLIIIATGAVRAHRYPERYGPRGAFGGRPRQSRAKGLARAVLDTIPIVKFGNQSPPKPDPELELEPHTNDGRDAATQQPVSNLSEEQRKPGDVVRTTAGTDHDGASAATRASQVTGGSNVDGDDDHLGCSICTEDFTVGEDVRVLPCHHQFHPNCIDPWLINVSGTCPLCRYDLRPDQTDTFEGSTSGSEGGSLPPPLALDGYENDGTHISHRNRLSRLFDINRLRQASREEQMEALRRMRAETSDADHHTAESETGGQRARLSERLKERFRIRTRAQSAEQRLC